VTEPFRLFMPLLVPLLAAGAELVVDHATVACASLKAGMTALSTAGIRGDYGGPHSNHATEMAIVSFPDGSYLELIAPQSNPDPKMLAAHPWAKLMRENAGPCAWAARTADLGAESQRLKSAGIPVGDPEQSGRERPDGVRLEWKTVQVGSESRGSFFPFLIQDLTPRKNRAYPRGKPSAPDFSGVLRVVVAVRDLEDAAKRYRQAYGLPAPLKQVSPEFGAHLALMGGTPVVLAQPLGSASWLAARIEQFGEGPCAFVVGARKGHHAAKSKSRWFGRDISWLDDEKLGWKLGIE
jgi:hypothetical protein